MRDYFGDNLVFFDEKFRRRFRMNKSLFLRIVDGLSNKYEYFQQRVDALGRLGHSPLQKCTVAMRMIAYGMPTDAFDEYIHIGESTSLECLRRFCKGIVKVFGAEYLRRPNENDLTRLLTVAEERSFTGMLGSIDCMHWGWKNCPVAWQGQFSRGDHGYPTIVLEAVASYDTWIWHSFFGVPGTCNDINVLNQSPVFDDILSGSNYPVEFTINNHDYDLGYYLADGIYPQWATFVSSVRDPQTRKEKLFAERQESCRKDVERAFGLLQLRFNIVKANAKLWRIEDLGEIMSACIIMHNMIVEDEGHKYAIFYDASQYDRRDPNTSLMDYTMGPTQNFRDHIHMRRRIRNKPWNARLKADLIEHTWSRAGHG